MSDPEILFERRGAVGLITLNRPKALNALTHGMCVAMKETLDRWSVDPAVSAVVITGTGDRAFCAGGDIRALYDSGKAGTPYARTFYRDEYRLDATIKHYRKPFVALVHGIVMGGGVGVSVNGQFRVADETTTFAMPETGIGLFPDVGGSFFLPRCPGETGMFLALTGTRLRSSDTLSAGVATHYVPAARHEDLVASLSVGKTPAETLGRLSMAPPEKGILDDLRDRIDATFAHNSVEKILSALDRDNTVWAKETAAVIRTKSPTSTKLAFQQLRRGRELEFDDCMRMEFRMVNRVIDGCDFYEGVRATIIEKDNAPAWRPNSLQNVSDNDIESYFAPLPGAELDLSGT